MDISVAAGTLGGLIFGKLFTDAIEFAGTIFGSECLFVDSGVAWSSKIRDFIFGLGRALADLHRCSWL